MQHLLGGFRRRSAFVGSNMMGVWSLRKESPVSSTLEAVNFAYLNARTGWPDLPGESDGCVIIASSTMSSGDTLDGSAWAKSIKPRAVIVVDDLGIGIRPRVNLAFGQSIVLPLVTPIAAELTYQLGRGSASQP